MAMKQTFTAKLEKHPKMDAAGVTVPFDVEQVFGAKRVPVVVMINGVEYRTTIVRMGGSYMFGVPKHLRESAGISPGETIKIAVWRDDEERIIEPPKDLAAELKKDTDLKKAWDHLSFTAKKEAARDLEESKKPETRARRLGKTLAMLKGRIKN